MNNLKPATKYILTAIFIEFIAIILVLYLLGMGVEGSFSITILIVAAVTYFVSYQLGEKIPYERYTNRVLLGIGIQFWLLLLMVIVAWFCLLFFTVLKGSGVDGDIFKALIWMVLLTLFFGGIPTFLIGLLLGYKLSTIKNTKQIIFEHPLMEYTQYKESQLSGRYITLPMITPLLQKHTFESEILLGISNQENPIYLYQIGKGKKKILMWSQMHGNESTTTKALFDVINYMEKNPQTFENISVFFIPMLNPDGANLYTRENALGVDLNRDAYDLSQPESKCLRKAYNLVGPDFCFNLHDQRTIFSAGKTSNPATVSFLAPSYNGAREINSTRRKAMEIIVVMNAMLQKKIPNQVGRFDDSFNLSCTGDMFTYLGTPTILFESGHYQNDYAREETRKYIALSILEAMAYINKNEIEGVHYESYFEIPENDTLFFDILLRDDFYKNSNDIGVLFKEKLINNEIYFESYIKEKRNLSNYHGHQELNLSEFFTDSIDKKDIEKHLDLRDFDFKIT